MPQRQGDVRREALNSGWADGLRAGRGLDTLTNYHEHVRRLEQREPTQLTFLT